MNSLSPCPSCRRHVEVGETDCPFCHTRFERLLAVARPSGSGHLSRTALFAAGATLVGMAAACSSSSTSADGGAGTGGAGGTVSSHGGAGGTVSSSGGAGGQGGEAGRDGGAGGASSPTDGAVDHVTVAIYSAPFPPY